MIRRQPEMPLALETVQFAVPDVDLNRLSDKPVFPHTRRYLKGSAASCPIVLILILASLFCVECPTYQWFGAV